MNDEAHWAGVQHGSSLGLDEQQVAAIVQMVPGGASNVQDIYPLSPLQEGMLFHRLLNEKDDTYVLSTLFEIASREQVAALADALQKVVDRHDVLRTAVLWRDLPRPVQVVHRRVLLPVEHVALDGERDLAQQIDEWTSPVYRRLELQQAPLVRLEVASAPHGSQCYAVLRVHHLLCDHASLRAVVAEAMAFLDGRDADLPPVVPFKEHVVAALAEGAATDSVSFFRDRLADVDEPTAPFGILDVHGDGRRVEEADEVLDDALAQEIRVCAQRNGMSPARLLHAAWALVVARTSGRDDVVYGTALLSGRQRSARDRHMLGMAVNTLPLRLRLRDVSVAQLVHQTQHELSELLRHEHVPLTVAQGCSGVPTAAPLFTTLLNCRRSAPDASECDRPEVRVLGRREAWTNYPIAVTVDDLGEGFRITAQTDPRVEPRRIVGYLRTALQSLVRALTQTPQRQALSLDVLPASERQEIVELFNATEAAYPRDTLVHELFAQEARQRGEQTAVVHGQQSLSYAELDRRSNQLARHLCERGVGPGQHVGVCIERSVDMIVGLLGILKAGAAYLPLDPNYPPSRLQYMLEDAAPRVVLTQESLKGSLPVTSAEVIALDSHWPVIATYATESLSVDASSRSVERLVYVIYTSGSTGRPKATAMPHRAMVNLIEWHRRTLPLAPGERVLQFAALSFDVAFQEIFSTLCLGGTLALLDEWVRKDAQALLRLLGAQCIERLFVPPLMLQSLAEAWHTSGAATAPARLRDVITAGEQLRISSEIVGFFKELGACRLHNHYGPTETHVVTALTLAANPDTWPTLPTIGRPIANTQIYVLDQRREPAPIGVPAEIYIAGDCVAWGYLHRAELTAQRFVTDPYRCESRARMYRTGDLGRWRTDGTLEYLGRNDDQVKVRGHRVELGEIEAQLAKHPLVREAAVIAREYASADVRLVAYATLRRDEGASVEELRTHLKSALPEHMVPSAVVVLAQLPLTPSGKLNRRELPVPELGVHTDANHEAPDGEVEQALAQVWQELLCVARIGRQDDFFELGGNSLLAMRVVARARSLFAIEVPIRLLFEHRTLEALARQVSELRARQLLDAIVGDEASTHDLLATVAALPDSGVRDLLRNLHMETRP